MTRPPVRDDEARLRRGRAGLTRALTRWGISSVLAGAALSAVAGQGEGSSVVRGAGRQTAAWGAVDLVVAWLARRGDARPVADVQAASRRLARVLWTNAGLDLLCLAGAAELVRRGRIGRSDVRGDGAAVLVQGGFLLVLDVGAALRLGRTTRV